MASEDSDGATGRHENGSGCLKFWSELDSDSFLEDYSWYSKGWKWAKREMELAVRQPGFNGS